MNPAIRNAEASGIDFTVHEFEPQGDARDALEAAPFVDDLSRVFKTLIVRFDSRDLAMAIVPLPAQLDLKALAKTAGAKKAEMAPPADAERATGYTLGGVSPLGQKKRLAAYLDASAMNHATIFVSGGKRGLELELAPNALAGAIGAGSLPLIR